MTPCILATGFPISARCPEQASCRSLWSRAFYLGGRLQTCKNECAFSIMWITRQHHQYSPHRRTQTVDKLVSISISRGRIIITALLNRTFEASRKCCMWVFSLSSYKQIPSNYINGSYDSLYFGHRLPGSIADSI